ncbi:MAG: 2-succinyl-5-enolpyruvyl-6-hydroxy-3-cyclohexene-1-carboxylic-acid synthase [Polyangiaceae bacterium]|nr:2-succinyl-5-enolpyruvyl-6-hydroxy-3-cyclohexene-1-carboxylic-acid synthase [Myxococcales bacterium]MCB9587847.1 2-succinyl-5-enolpyruvyl-6-hydroxy-3-cyclohexene-1-carboxylic-acid synthase [Polyangiaceae bacterium]MCB9608796.1 2-succinyl-5-enolpyruvyl-6-hydroxy-3-cyclohexene-1-carboxylic-acid synthase [Polyangiaceae bacterium]
MHSRGPDSATAAHLTSSWARLLMHTLWDAGVEHFVVSPGSRSTPFTWALMQLTRQPDGPSAQIVLDERSAGFVALGVARASGKPAALLCTSGSAAANYFPAVVEARAAGLPLLLVTSDRPTELGQCGAPQTLDQLKLYGDQAVGFFELGQAESDLRAWRGLRRIALQAYATSIGPIPGPVQLNVRARKPLEPEPDGPLKSFVDSLVGPHPQNLIRTEVSISEVAAEHLAQRLKQAKRGAIVCGPLSPSQAAPRELLQRISKASGWPLWCEATSNAESGDAVTRFDTWLRDEAARRELTPDVILQLGPAPTSGSLLRVLDQFEIERHVICPFGYQDPANRAASVQRADLGPSLRRLLTRLETAPAAELYCERLMRVEAACGAALVEVLEACDGESQLSEASAFDAVLQNLPEAATLSVGNSLAVREVDWFRRHRLPGRVLSQRGLNGIDGNVSGAFGARLAGAAGPHLLLLGDLSFLHDLGGLGAALRATQPLVVCVINNAGGRIFEMLPLASEVDAAALEPWTTPHRANLEHAAGIHGIAYFQANTRSEIKASLDACLNRNAAAVVEVRVADQSSISAQRALWRRASERISAAL